MSHKNYDVETEEIYSPDEDETIEKRNEYWCAECKIETSEKECPVCGKETVEGVPLQVYWCKNCNTPIIHKMNQIDKGICPICGKKTKYLTTDIRPVFPEERLLLELLLDKEPHAFIRNSVWAAGSRYYIDGKSIAIPNELFQTADAETIREKLNEHQRTNSYKYFNEHINTFINANANRLNYLKTESYEFVRETASKFDEEKLVISFSGGKDSTVTADVVVKALSNPSLVHIFGNTTLEFPSTVAYAERFRENHPQAIFLFAKNDEQVFMDVCEDIGPPARLMRWCCSMFKTGPITRVINSLYRNQSAEANIIVLRMMQSLLRFSNRQLLHLYSFGKILISGSIFCQKR